MDKMEKRMKNLTDMTFILDSKRIWSNQSTLDSEIYSWFQYGELICFAIAAL